MNSDIPNYINDFISFNASTLKDIYEVGCANESEGLLMINCDVTNNDSDVYFTSKKRFIDMGKAEFYNDIKTNIKEDQKDDMILYIMDKSLNKVFLLIIKK
jgi:hypothetical protein